jgi:competence protein ComGC
MKMQNISFFDSLAIYRHNEIMKKKSYLIIKIIGGLLLAIIVILFTIPVIFKDKIRTTIENSISESVNAQVRFGDYKLGSSEIFQISHFRSTILPLWELTNLKMIL